MRTGYLSEIFASFQGEGAHVGCRHLFVRMAGCNLRCRYCDTPESLERTDAYRVFGGGLPPRSERNPVSAKDLAQLIRSMLAQEVPIDALALTGGEPLAQSDFLRELLEVGRFPLPVLLETNGILPHRLRDLLELVHIISMDIKLPSNTGEGASWEEHSAFLELARTKDLYVKILLDQQTRGEDVERAASLVAPIKPSVPVFLQPIVDAAARPLIDLDRLTQFYVIARRRLPSVRVLPQTHKLIGIR